MSATAEAVQSARQMLHSAIRAGKDTLKPRRELTEAEQAEARERAANDAILSQMEQARADAIAKEVHAECAQLYAEILAECAEYLPNFEPTITVESHRLTALLEARGRADAALAAKAELENDIATLTSRLAEIQTAIDQLHAKPDRSEADNGRAHFLMLDRSDLAALIEAAQSQLEALEIPPLADLQRAWNEAQIAARFGARRQVMTALEARLMAMAVEARDSVGHAAFLRYTPSAVMRQAAQQAIV